MPRRDAFLGDRIEAVERHPLHAGHRGDVLDDVVAVEDEHRQDQVARVDARLAHEIAAPGFAAQAPRAARGVGRRRQHGAILGTPLAAARGLRGATDNRPMASSFLWVKALHIVFVSSWFAGLFYLPRLFVNLASVPADSHAERERLLMMARKLYRFSSLLMVVAIALGLVLWLVYGVGKGPHNYWLHAKIVLVVVAIGYHHACRSLLQKVRGVRQHEQRALVSRLQRVGDPPLHRDRRPRRRQAVLGRMPRHRSSAVPLSWLYVGLIVYASLYPFAGWRVPGVGPLDFLVLGWPRWWTTFDLVANLLGYLPLGFLLFVALIRGGRRAGAAALIAASARTLLSFDDGGAAELPAASRRVERRSRPQRRSAPRSASPSAPRCTGAAASPAGRRCATAGSSRAAPAAWRCSSSGRSACSFRPRCRSASATSSAGSSR